MATLYSAYAVVLFLLRGSDPFTHNRVTLWAVLLTYYVAGTLGGMVVGAMSPIARTWLGTIATGTAAALIFFFCALSATHGPFWMWQSEDWFEILFLGTLFGTICGIGWRKIVAP